MIPSLGAGGSERVLSQMADRWAERGRDVVFITFQDARLDFFTLHPHVRRVSLGELSVERSAGRLAKNVRRIHALRSVAKQASPDAVISFLYTANILVLFATMRLGIPAVVSERTDPRRFPIGLMQGSLRRLVYRRAAALVVQTPDVFDWAAGLVGRSKVRVIPNPVVTPTAGATRHGDGSSRPWIAALGRLGHEKGFDLLIEAFAQVSHDHPSWSLVIYGDGPERDALIQLAQRLGVAGRVQLPGRVVDPASTLRDASLFVLPSRVEGFPNALLEAMAMGLPVISTDCDSGPRNIVRNGVDGVLVPPGDADVLARAMSTLMTDDGLRRRLAAAAPDVITRFAVEGIMAQWDELLSTL